jgi:hypothetical protein
MTQLGLKVDVVTTSSDYPGIYLLFWKVSLVKNIYNGSCFLDQLQASRHVRMTTNGDGMILNRQLAG